MIETTFSFSSTISAAWKLIKKEWKFLILAVLATVAVFIVLQVLKSVSEHHIIPSIIVTLVSIIVGIAITLGWTNVVLKMIRSGRATWSDFKTDTRSWPHYFLARIIYGIFMVAAVIIILLPILAIVALSLPIPLIVIVGILLFVGGLMLLIWVGIRYMFITFIAIDQPKLRAWKMMQASAKLSKGHMFDLFGFVMLMLLINIVGLLLFVVGLIITVPLSKIATVYVYEYLKEKQANV